MIDKNNNIPLANNHMLHTMNTNSQQTWHLKNRQSRLLHLSVICSPTIISMIKSGQDQCRVIQR